MAVGDPAAAIAAAAVASVATAANSTTCVVSCDRHHPLCGCLGAAGKGSRADPGAVLTTIVVYAAIAFPRHDDAEGLDIGWQTEFVL